MSDPDEVQLNLVSPTAVITGWCLAFTISLAVVLLAGWVCWHRNDPAVRVMQPFFLLMLCFGTFLVSMAVIPYGKDDTNTTNIDQACTATLWLSDVGMTFILSALFSKLWRISTIVHAANSFQRKNVTLKHALVPFATLMTIDLIILTTITILDPQVWKREPIDGDENNTVGYCAIEGTIGKVMLFLLNALEFVLIIILCVQAYVARDVQPEFSQVRGISLTLFSWLQIDIVSLPALALIEDSNTTASFILTVIRYVSMMLSLLLFIFGPLVFQQRKRQREGGDSRLPQRTTTVTMSNDSNAETASHELQGARFRIAELEVQVENLSSRIKELETMPAACVTVRDFTILDENV